MAFSSDKVLTGFFATVALVANMNVMAQDNGSALTIAANSIPATSASVKYNPAEGIRTGIDYERAEIAKFVCLNKDPAKGAVSESCGKITTHEIAYTASKGNYSTLILTKDFSSGRGLVVEKGSEGKFMVHFIIEDMHFDRVGNIVKDAAGKIVVPDWVATTTVAPEYKEILAVADCNKEKGCVSYPAGLSYTYNNGGNYIAGGKILSGGNKGNQFMFRVTSAGIASMDIVSRVGASHYSGTYTNVNGSRSVLDRLDTYSTAMVAPALNKN